MQQQTGEQINVDAHLRCAVRIVADDVNMSAETVAVEQIDREDREGDHPIDLDRHAVEIRREDREGPTFS